MFSFFFLMIRRPPRSTPHSFPTRRSSDLKALYYTMASVRDQLNRSLVVDHPVTPNETITNGSSDAKAAFLRDKRSEEHTSELQSLMRISYAVFCLKKKKKKKNQVNTTSMKHTKSTMIYY